MRIVIVTGTSRETGARLSRGLAESGPIVSTGLPDPEGPAVSAYQERLAPYFAADDEARRELKSPPSVVDLVKRIVEGKSSGFRHRIGALADATEASVRAEELDAVAIVRKALGIDWWTTGTNRPSPAAS